MARMKKLKNPELLNRHQKLARRPGEHRVGSEQIAELLAFSLSDDAAERLEAAENLCPCHVRTRIDEVWDALYRLMQDGDVRVRKAAWHTLEDGGYPKDDPRMDAILEHALEHETDNKVRRFVEMYTKGDREREAFLFKVKNQTLGMTDYHLQGKCDFCGESDRKVKKDFHNPLSFDGESRPALICEACDR